MGGYYIDNFGSFCIVMILYNYICMLARRNRINVYDVNKLARVGIANHQF